MNIAVDAKNFFILGWVSCLLYLPRKHPCSSSLKEEYIKQFNDGYDMCAETGVNAYRALLNEKDNGNISIIWVNDDNEELDENGKIV